MIHYNIITWLHGWNIEYRNTLEGYMELNGLSVERAADESSSSLCWCLAFTASSVAQFVPRCLLECVCRGMDSGSMVVDHCRRSECVLKLALSNVTVHWTFKVDLWISRNRPIVDIRSSRGGRVHRGFSGEQRSHGCGGRSWRFHHKGGTPRRASMWQFSSN